jgi:hypothetical protein
VAEAAAIVPAGGARRVRQQRQLKKQLTRLRPSCWKLRVRRQHPSWRQPTEAVRCCGGGGNEQASTDEKVVCEGEKTREPRGARREAAWRAGGGARRVRHCRGRLGKLGEIVVGTAVCARRYESKVKR